jgi:hypothetical protein
MPSPVVLLDRSGSRDGVVRRRGKIEGQQIVLSDVRVCREQTPELPL